MKITPTQWRDPRFSEPTTREMLFLVEGYANSWRAYTSMWLEGRMKVYPPGFNQPAFEARLDDWKDVAEKITEYRAKNA